MNNSHSEKLIYHNNTTFAVVATFYNKNEFVILSNVYQGKLNSNEIKQ